MYTIQLHIIHSKKYITCPLVQSFEALENRLSTHTSLDTIQEVDDFLHVIVVSLYTKFISQTVTLKLFGNYKWTGHENSCAKGQFRISLYNYQLLH